MVCHAGERPALETLVPIVYIVADLQRPKHANVALTLHRVANLKNSILISSYYYIFVHILTHYYYLEPSQQTRDVHRPQHRVYVQTTTIGRQCRQHKARKVIATKLVEEVGNFFREVA